MAQMESDRDRAIRKKEAYRKIFSKIYMRVILTFISVTACPALIYSFFKTDVVGTMGPFAWVVLAGLILFTFCLLSLGIQGTKGFAFSMMFHDADREEKQ